MSLRGPEDIPDSPWHPGSTKSYVGLWLAGSQYTDWTGSWAGNDPPLEGHGWDASRPGGPALTPHPGAGTPTAPTPAAIPTTPTPPAATANLLVNGSLEAKELVAGTFTHPRSMLGWTAPPGGRMELWTARLGMQATDGVDLDVQSATDGLHQEVRTSAGQCYTISLDLTA